MTREEITNSRAYQVSKAALEYYNEHQQYNDIDLTEAFEAGAEWADRTMIDKACKWIKNYVENAFTEVNGMMIELHGIELSEDFRKAMGL